MPTKHYFAYMRIEEAELKSMQKKVESIYNQGSKAYKGARKGLSLPPNRSCPDSFLPPSPPPITISTNTIK